MTRTSHLTIDLPDADATRSLGRSLASLLRAGDLVMLTGDLGAGKTTLTQGIGSGLDVRGQVASPTFVIARVHPPLSDGPALVHVDAYRLGSLDEVDALDLDASLDESVTVVEWGRGLVESIARDRLEVTLSRPRGAAGSSQDDLAAILDDAETGTRRVSIEGYGDRWAGLALPGAVDAGPATSEPEPTVPRTQTPTQPQTSTPTPPSAAAPDQPAGDLAAPDQPAGDQAAPAGRSESVG